MSEAEIRDMKTLENKMADLIYSLELTLGIAKEFSQLLPYESAENRNEVAIYGGNLSVREMLILIAKRNNKILEVKRAILSVMYSKNLPDRSFTAQRIYSTLSYAREFKKLSRGKYELI